MLDYILIAAELILLAVIIVLFLQIRNNAKNPPDNKDLEDAWARNIKQRMIGLTACLLAECILVIISIVLRLVELLGG